MSLYELLGVAADADQAVIRRAYLALARQYHPDLNQGPGRQAAEDAMQEVNEAWSVLGDPTRRRDYDFRLRTEAANRLRDQRQFGGTSQNWEPFDADDDPQANLDPRPIAGSRAIPRSITLAPAGLLIIGVLVLGLGFLVDSRDVLAVGGVLFVFALAGFILMPLLAMSRAEKDPYL